jgi:hypothetical protein
MRIVMIDREIRESIRLIMAGKLVLRESLLGIFRRSPDKEIGRMKYIMNHRPPL